MPNGGPTPDCIHCELFDGTVKGPWHCKLHGIKLASPIRAFCAGYVDPEPTEYGDWLDQELKRSDLKSDWMYVWIDWSDEENWEAKGIKQTFEHFPLASITEYRNWSFDDFSKAISVIAETKRGS
jgi:hypothetical protein